MNDYFVLAIRENCGKRILSWEFRKIDANGERKVAIAFSAEIHDDMLGKIKSEFSDFPAWW
ncbi:hypothetical protein [Herbaspirillum sp. RV1423]|uniref:hypothetical protein n=1 Tax=Herbaspirillum sp. RV1423 TaxID=1443993 RepID=UPI00054D3C31|nr:hypothetical protein [Herbaspirillum sp. RV1423]